jgi:hypothetical protein
MSSLQSLDELIQYHPRHAQSQSRRVADAEQIIYVSIDKKDGKHDFNFFSGAIEEPRINQAGVDILVDILPAFDNRRLQYRRQARDGT